MHAHIYDIHACMHIQTNLAFMSMAGCICVSCGYLRPEHNMVHARPYCVLVCTIMSLRCTCSVLHMLTDVYRLTVHGCLFQDILMMDALPMGLAVKTASGDIQVVIPKSTKIPAR